MKSRQVGPLLLAFFLASPILAVTDETPGQSPEKVHRLVKPKHNASPGVNKEESRLPYLDANPYYKLDQELTAAKKKKRKGKRRKKSGGAAKAEEASSGGISALHFVPAGGGQFANGSPILGSVVALATVGGFVFMFMSYSNANAKVDETNVYIDQRNAEFDKLSTNAEKTAHQEETNRVVADFDAEAEAMVQQANMGMIIGLVAGIGGYIEGFINSGPDESAESSKPMKKKRRKKRRSKKKASLESSSAYELTINDEDWYDWKARTYDSEFRWNVLPGQQDLNSKKYSYRPGTVSVNLHYKF